MKTRIEYQTAILTAINSGFLHWARFLIMLYRRDYPEATE